jgi:hypothetical protein
MAGAMAAPCPATARLTVRVAVQVRGTATVRQATTGQTSPMGSAVPALAAQVAAAGLVTRAPPGLLVPGPLVPGLLVPGPLVPGLLVPGLLVPGPLVPGLLVLVGLVRRTPTVGVGAPSRLADSVRRCRVSRPEDSADRSALAAREGTARAAAGPAITERLAVTARGTATVRGTVTGLVAVMALTAALVRMVSARRPDSGRGGRTPTGTCVATAASSRPGGLASAAGMAMVRTTST